ncbi:MAG: hypothetical protein Q8942_02255 [Bacillota bacterium]|nr:hypothetical protein [Bacillota bacterium]
MNVNMELRCYNCQSVVVELPVSKLSKKEGLNFLCENCGHFNVLKHKMLQKGIERNPFINIFGIDERDTAF